MTSPSANSTIGLLASGGLDSCILVGHLLRQGHGVSAVLRPRRFALGRGRIIGVAGVLAGLQHAAVGRTGGLRSAAGRPVRRSLEHRRPRRADARSPDSTVYLPGRNALLGIKPAIWCAMHGIGELALATLAGNPFADATDEFFRDFQRAMDRATGSPVNILHPSPARRGRLAIGTRAAVGTYVFLHRPERRVFTAAAATSAPNDSGPFVRPDSMIPHPIRATCSTSHVKSTSATGTAC